MFERENVDIIIPTIASKKFTRTYQSPNVSPISPLLHLALHSFSFYLRGVFYAPFFVVAKIGFYIVRYVPTMLLGEIFTEGFSKLKGKFKSSFIFI